MALMKSRCIHPNAYWASTFGCQKDLKLNIPNAIPIFFTPSL